MRKEQENIIVETIPVDQIAFPNPRSRNSKAFQEMVESISSVGLKKPITVSRSRKKNGGRPFELVCGQGRLEAYISLGASEIPAIIDDVDEADSMIMSLVENLARRQHRPLELLHDISRLGKQGYSTAEIAAKTGLSCEYVHSVRHLLEEGEERLLTAVEAGQIPLTIATIIAEAEGDDVQAALAQAYQEGHLRGKKLLAAKRIVAQRRRRGKTMTLQSRPGRQSRISSTALVRAYKKEADRQRLMIRRAEITQHRLLFLVEAMRTLLADGNFSNLLRAEGLMTMPRPLADLTSAGEVR
jgi:ParB family transcriptional regulator, chromosome partitioning protein